MKEVILTAEGYKKLQQEIDLLRGDKRREVAERIRIAREFGDIAENAEYDDAKNEQAMLEHKIAQLEDRLLTARVITKKEILKDAVSVGSHVRLRDMQANKTFEYHIVGSAEANPTENKLSNESPVGKAIMGRKKGEVVEVDRSPRRAEVQDHGDQGGLGSFERGSSSMSHVRDGRLTSRAWRSCELAVIGSATRATCSRARFCTTPRGSG